MSRLEVKVGKINVRIFLTKLKDKFNSDWPKSINETTKMVLTGLTTVADWISSGCEGDFDDQVDDRITKAATEAIENAGYIKPDFKKNLKFDEIFGFDP